jgi:hypothetical protein
MTKPPITFQERAEADIAMVREVENRFLLMPSRHRVMNRRFQLGALERVWFLSYYWSRPSRIRSA